MAPSPTSPQLPGELAPERPPRLHVEGAVDRLVGDVHRLIVGVADPEPARDPLGEVVLSEASAVPQGRLTETAVVGPRALGFSDGPQGLGR
jgi:hypothetical protein